MDDIFRGHVEHHRLPDRQVQLVSSDDDLIWVTYLPPPLMSYYLNHKVLRSFCL
jgi:hypothetical protein